MAINPTLHDEIITSPIERMLNDKDIFLQINIFLHICSMNIS